MVFLTDLQAFCNSLPQDFGLKVAANVTPLVLLALGTHYVVNKMDENRHAVLENRKWAVDLREHRQYSVRRLQSINGALVIGGMFMSAYAIIKAIGTMVAAATAGTYVATIWLGVGAAILLNHWVYQQYVPHDGSPVGPVQIKR